MPENLTGNRKTFLIACVELVSAAVLAAITCLVPLVAIIYLAPLCVDLIKKG